MYDRDHPVPSLPYPSVPLSLQKIGRKLLVSLVTESKFSAGLAPHAFDEESYVVHTTVRKLIADEVYLRSRDLYRVVTQTGAPSPFDRDLTSVRSGISPRTAAMVQENANRVAMLLSVSPRIYVPASLSTGLARRMRRVKLCGRPPRLSLDFVLRIRLPIPYLPGLKGLPETPPLKGYKP